MALVKVDLDLGKSYDEPVPVNPSDEKGKYYPSFHYSDEDEDGEDMDDFPKKGQMLIEYEITRSTETTKSDGSVCYDCDVQVKKIISVEGKMNAPTGNGSKRTEDALDALAEALEERMSGESEGEEGEAEGGY